MPARRDERPRGHEPGPDGPDFRPLRTDPPPVLEPTWRRRYAATLAASLAMVVTIAVEVFVRPTPLVAASLPIAAHAAVGVALAVWSRPAIDNLGLLVPPERYSLPITGRLTAGAWLVATGVAVVCLASVGELAAPGRRANEVGGIEALMTALVLMAFAAWSLPFGCLARIGRRAGVPSRRVAAWFWVPLVTAVAGLTAVSLVVRNGLGDDPSRLDLLVEVTIGYGVAMGAFVVLTWRTTTVVDEVADLRWQRWRADWERTIDDMLAGPPPPPEPALNRRDPSL